MPATYGGASIFGRSVTVRHVPNPPAEQINAFFGVGGLQSLFGGSRGRLIVVTGVLYGADVNDLNAAEATLASYCDGIARTLVDVRGRSFPSVLLRPAEMIGRVLQNPDGSCILPYQVSGLGLL
jgi:hypothetical protein